MKRVAMLLAMLSLFLLVSCARENGFDAGETLTGEELAKLQESLVEEKNHPAESDEENAECYYTASGSVYHKDRNCSYLKNAKEVLAGTIEEAKTSGASRPCSRCAKEEQAEQ